MQDHLIKRGARYSVRRKIPLDLQSHYGKKEIVRALGTSDLAEAKRLARIQDVRIDEEFARTRSVVAEQAKSPPPLSPQLLSTAEEHNAFEQAMLAHDEEAEILAPVWEAEHKAFEQHKLVMIAALRDLGIGTASIIPTHLASNLGSNAVPAPHTSQPSKTSLPESATAPLYLSDIADRWAQERSPDPRTIGIARKIVSRFNELCGLLPARNIQRRTVIDFKDKLLASGQTPVNTDKQLSLLGTLLNFAADNLLIESNPAKGIRVGERRNAKAARLPFDLPALRAIFTSPIYTQAARPEGGAGEAAYWLPLLALFTGARVEELAQLHPDDIYEETYHDTHDSEKTCHVLRISAAAEGQAVKNEGSNRRFPIHPALIERGFVQFAKSHAGKVRIFDKLKADKLGVESANWSKWFGKYLRNVCDVQDKRMVFHSFRHTFKHAARESGIAEDIADAITGHAGAGVARKYGGLNYPLRPMVEAMAHYRIPGLALPPAP